jgi:large subunit ribosomal protein L33
VNLDGGINALALFSSGVRPMREYVTLECSECGSRNYRTPIDPRAQNKLSLKKFCKVDRKHTLHKERKK